MPLLLPVHLAYRTFGIESGKMEYWTGLVIEVQAMIRKWRNSDIERYKNL